VIMNTLDKEVWVSVMQLVKYLVEQIQAVPGGMCQTSGECSLC